MKLTVAIGISCFAAGFIISNMMQPTPVQLEQPEINGNVLVSKDAE